MKARESTGRMLPVALLLAVGVGLVVLAAGCEKKGSAPAVKPSSRALPPPPAADGRPLYAFLLAQASELVSKVPCACCGKALAWCYRGGCPET